MPDDNWTLISIAIATPMILAATLLRLVNLLAATPSTGGLTLSLSYDVLLDFAVAEHDRGEVLKTYFEWKHDVLLEMLKAAAAFALANLALVMKFIIDPDPASLAKIEELVHLRVGPSILAGFGAVLLAGVWITLRLRRIPIEYSVCVRFMDRMR